ncbi:MAG: hypothetical protein ACE10K_05790 [Rhodothermales bacterium]
MPSVSENEIDAYQRQVFFEQLNASVRRWEEERPDLWQQELEERRLWENTLADGLENDPYEIE